MPSLNHTVTVCALQAHCCQASCTAYMEEAPQKKDTTCFDARSAKVEVVTIKGYCATACRCIGLPSHSVMVCRLSVHSFPCAIRLKVQLHLGGNCGTQPAHKTCGKPTQPLTLTSVL